MADNTTGTGAEQATTKKRGSRGNGRRLRRQIEQAARERQHGWADDGQPKATLTSALERLYEELREERAGDAGSPVLRHAPALPEPASRRRVIR